MSSTFGGSRFVKPVDFRLVRYPAAASTVISIGDLLYWDAGTSTVKPFSAYVGSGTAATDRTALAALFVGVAVQQRLIQQVVAGEIEVVTECIYEADCASASTYLPGDMVSVVSSAAAAAGAISDQAVVETATLAEAIGVVTKYATGSITKVTVRLIGLAARNKI